MLLCHRIHRMCTYCCYEKMVCDASLESITSIIWCCSIQSRHQCSLHLFHIMKTEKVHIQNNLFRNFCKRKKCAFSSAWWSAQSNHSIVASIETTVNAMTCDITVENACKEKTQSQNICWILAHQHHHAISVEHLLGSHVLCMTCFDGIDCIE